MTSPLRLTAVLSLVSGSALVVDIVTIVVLNRSFDPLDSILFFIGFVGMLLAVAALGVALSEGRRGAARVGVAVAVFVVTAVVLGVISAVADRIGRHVFSPANVGLHGEWSFFSIALCLLLISGWAWRRSAVVQNDPHGSDAANHEDRPGVPRP